MTDEMTRAYRGRGLGVDNGALRRDDCKQPSKAIVIRDPRRQQAFERIDRIRIRMIKGFIDAKAHLRRTATVINRDAIVADGNFGLDVDALVPTI